MLALDLICINMIYLDQIIHLIKAHPFPFLFKYREKTNTVPPTPNRVILQNGTVFSLYIYTQFIL